MRVRKHMIGMIVLGLAVMTTVHADEIGTRPDGDLDAAPSTDEASADTTSCLLCNLLDSLGFASDE